MADARYSIKDLEKLTGIKAHTLRIWEKRYGILRPERTDTNIRYYCDGELRKLFNIALLNRQGFKISLLSKLSVEDLNEKVVSLTQTENSGDLIIDSLLSAMVELDEAKFEKLLSKSIMNLGFEETLAKVIQPLFEKIGILWQTGSVNAAQEHFISNLIRQKIIVAIDGVIATAPATPRTFFLFLREGEWHELKLLIMAYLVKKSGHKLVYFGQSLPIDCLSKAISAHDPDFLVTAFTCSLQDVETRAFILQLSAAFADKQLYITGFQVETKGVSYPDNVRVIANLQEFRDELAAME